MKYLWKTKTGLWMTGMKYRPGQSLSTMTNGSFSVRNLLRELTVAVAVAKEIWIRHQGNEMRRLRTCHSKEETKTEGQDQDQLMTHPGVKVTRASEAHLAEIRLQGDLRNKLYINSREQSVPLKRVRRRALLISQGHLPEAIA